MHDQSTIKVLVKQAVLHSVSLSLHWEWQHWTSLWDATQLFLLILKNDTYRNDKTNKAQRVLRLTTIPSLFLSVTYFLQNSYR